MALAHDTTAMRLLGAATGLMFGGLLQRGRLSRREVIVGQLLFRDGRVVKAMGSAVVVGALGIRALRKRGLVEERIQPMNSGGVIGGAAVFGAGLALCGYCPGTSLAAAGEGRRDAAVAVLGMLAGAAAFVALYPRIRPVLEVGAELGKATLPSLATSGAAAWAEALETKALAGPVVGLTK